MVLELKYLYYFLRLNFLDVSSFACSGFILTTWLDHKYCNLICEVYDCAKSVTHWYLLSKRLQTWWLLSIWSSVLSAIPPSIELIWFSMWSSNNWVDGITDNFNSLRKNNVFPIWIRFFQWDYHQQLTSLYNNMLHAFYLTKLCIY